jgi:septum formation protein
MKTPRPRLLLASSSPRRRQLLARAGYDFAVLAPAIDEISTSRFTLRESTAWNSLRKGLAVARQSPNDVILAADTLVGIDGRILGKPADRAEAESTLRLLSGRMHLVASSVFITHLAGGRSEHFTVLSRVFFKKLSDEMIAAYLDQIDPFDKAGAYAAQEEGRAVVSRIVGSRSNVIGLPLEKTGAALARFGIRPRRRRA